MTIGYMGNNIYPARIGELLRIYLLKRAEAVPISVSLATVTGGARLRWAGDAGISSSSISRGSVTWRPRPVLSEASGPGCVGRRHLPAGHVRLSGHGAVPESCRSDRRMVAVSSPGDCQGPWAARWMASSSASCRDLAFTAFARVDILMVFITSVVIWLIETAKYWLVMHAFDFRVSFFALMLMNGVVNLATTIPFGSGYIGTFDAPGIAVLQAFGVAGRLCGRLHPGACTPPCGCRSRCWACTSWLAQPERSRAAGRDGRGTAPVRVAVIGAGAGGLAAAYDLAGAGAHVTVFEAGDQSGGLAAGFNTPGWDWSVEQLLPPLVCQRQGNPAPGAGIGSSGTGCSSPGR